MKKNILISASDISGGYIVKGLTKTLIRKLDANIFLVGSTTIAYKNVMPLFLTGNSTHTGFTSILGDIAVYRLALRRVKDFLRNNRIDIAVLIDNPGFNLYLAKLLNGKGIKVVYISPPQVWAWGEWRIKYLKKYVFLNLVLLPFEEDYYKKRGINAIFIGNPSDRLKPQSKKSLSVFLPGSRENEVYYSFRYAGRPFQRWSLSHNLDIAVLLPDTPFSKKWVEYGRKYIDQASFYVGETDKFLIEAEIGVICSGTATLEATFADLPSVVIYRLSHLSYFLGRNFMKTEFISLPNIILGKEIQKEVWQYKMREKNFVSAMDYVWYNRRGIKEAYKQVKKLFARRFSFEGLVEILLEII